MRSTDSTMPSFPETLADDLLGALAVLEPHLVALEPQPFVARVEAGVDEPVRLRHEGLDLALALDDQRQRRRLDAAERDDPADPSAALDRGGTGRVHPDEPVRLGARAGSRLERPQLGARAEALEALADRLLGHRRDPQALDGLVDAGGLVDVREDQLALAARVAGVHNAVDVVASEQLVDRLELLLRLLVPRPDRGTRRG